MSSILTVRLDGTDEVAAARHRARLASLPRTFRATTGRVADVVVVAGSRAGWIETARAAVEGGTRAVLVDRPGGGEPDRILRLRDVAASYGAIVAVEALAFDPAWQRVQAALRESAARATLVHSLYVAPSGSLLAAALIEHVSLALALCGDFDGPADAGAVDHGYRIGATAVGGAPISLTGVRAGAYGARLELDLVGASDQWRVRFDLLAVAGPTRITRFDADGAALVADSYEGAARAVWRRLSRALVDDEPFPDTLVHLAHACAYSRRVFADALVGDGSAPRDNRSDSGRDASHRP